MNIPIFPESFKVESIAQDGTAFQFVDLIGFSEGNEMPGFNRFDTGWQDASGLAYPRLNEAALVVLPLYNQYDNENPVEKKIISGSPLREIEDSAVDYSEVRYDYGLEYGEDGWYSVAVFLLYRSDSPYASIDDIFYNVALESIVDQAGNVYQPEDLLTIEGVQKAVVQVRMTMKAEQEYQKANADWIKEYAKNKCSKQLRVYENKVNFMALFLSGAVTNFNRGLFYEFQKNMEMLWQAINRDDYVNY